MKIIKNNLEEEMKITRCTCEWCKSILDVSEEDIKINDGDKYFICPVCNEESYSNELRPNKYNISFPNDYRYFGNGVDIKNDEIDDDVRNLIKSFTDDEDDWYRMCGHGNSIVFVVKNVEEEVYDIYVCKDYHEAYIPMGD